MLTQFLLAVAVFAAPAADACPLIEGKFSLKRANDKRVLTIEIHTRHADPFSYAIASPTFLPADGAVHKERLKGKEYEKRLLCEGDTLIERASTYDVDTMRYKLIDPDTLDIRSVIEAFSGIYKRIK